MKRLLPKPVAARRQRGMTVIIVMVLLIVMLLGGAALARLSEVGTQASGNVAFHEAAIQASEVGLNNAFASVRALAVEDNAVAPWYSPVELPKDAYGLPTVTWSGITPISVGPAGAISVRFVVERACTVTPITDTLRQCLVRQEPLLGSATGTEPLDPPNSRQFRITVQVTGQKGTQTFVQSLVTRG